MAEQDAGQVAKAFYTALSARDARTMGALYADDAHFSDPIFPDLDAAHARAMWAMLFSSGSDLAVDHEILSNSLRQAVVRWTARYRFSRTGLPVVNVVTATLDVENGLIRRHRDKFSFYRWASQALGLPGRLIGWSPIIKARVRAQAAARLKAYIAQQAAARD